MHCGVLQLRVVCIVLLGAGLHDKSDVRAAIILGMLHCSGMGCIVSMTCAVQSRWGWCGTARGWGT